MPAAARRSSMYMYKQQSSAPAVQPARASTIQPTGRPAIDWTRQNQRQPRLVKDVVVVRQTTISFSGRASACSRRQPAELCASRTSGGDGVGEQGSRRVGLAWRRRRTYRPTDRLIRRPRPRGAAAAAEARCGRYWFLSVVDSTRRRRDSSSTYVQTMHAYTHAPRPHSSYTRALVTGVIPSASLHSKRVSFSLPFCRKAKPFARRPTGLELYFDALNHISLHIHLESL